MAKHDEPYNIRQPEKYLLTECKSNAKKRGIHFELTLEDIVIPRYCPVFLYELTFKGESYNSPSIDRLDSAVGYEPNNIVIVSWRANKLKSDASPHDLYELFKFYNFICKERGISYD